MGRSFPREPVGRWGRSVHVAQAACPGKLGRPGPGGRIPPNAAHRRRGNLLSAASTRTGEVSSAQSNSRRPDGDLAAGLGHPEEYSFRGHARQILGDFSFRAAARVARPPNTQATPGLEKAYLLWETCPIVVIPLLEQESRLLSSFARAPAFLILGRYPQQHATRLSRVANQKNSSLEVTHACAG